MYKTAVFVFFIISVSLMLAALFILSICGCWELYRKFNTSSINPEEIEEAGKQQQIKRKHISISTQKFISVMFFNSNKNGVIVKETLKFTFFFIY